MRLDTIPKRPSIPITLQLGLVLWGTSALTYSSLREYANNDWFKNFIIFFVLACVLGMILLLVVLWRSKTKLIIILLIGVLFGICISIISANNLSNNMQSILQAGEGEYTFKAEADQKVGTYTNNCDAKIANTNNKVKLQVPQDFEEVHAGDIIKAKVKFSSPAETQASNYWQNGICANARVSEAYKIPRTDTIGLIFGLRNHIINTIRNFD